MAKVKYGKKGWVVDYRIGGRRSRISFPAKQLAYNFLKEIQLRKVDRDFGYRPIEKKSLKDAIHEYVDLVSTRKARRTFVLERQVFERLYDYLGNIDVTDIQLRDMELFQRHLLSKFNLTAATVNRYFNVYRNFFSKCEDWNYISSIPTKKVKNFPIKVTTKKVWSDEDIFRLYSSCADWLKDIVFLLTYTGVRMGEACKLKWKDVDLEKRLLTVSSIKGTGDERLRSIPLPDPILQFLIQKKEKSRGLGKAQDQNFVFLNASGNPTSSTHVSRELSRQIRKVGLEGMLARNLRHTLLTYLAAQDLSLEKIRQIAGHTTLRTTENYLHLQDHHMRSTMEKAVEGRKILGRAEEWVGTSGH
ncbi:MAG: tyrosine-type recombinase/integrase [Bdellovibrionaceae bacterium]|nr:tyrosine-type recombinase/integrase [Pseudobdellovibrionaceae bacterium]